MHPLDYTFFMILAVWFLYGLGSFWNKFYRVRVNTKDDLIERYIKLVKYYEHRR